jgi:hypothetical protein
MEAEANAATERRAWWSARRLRYNAVLLIAAPVSLLALLGVWFLFEDQLPCLEITGFSIAIWAVLFPFALALANICYLLGPLSERLIRPRNPKDFRRWIFGAGTAFSLALIFSPVAATLTGALLALPCTDEFGQTHVPRRVPW